MNESSAPSKKTPNSGVNCHQTQKTMIGWREYVSLPDLGIDKIKVKVDTGARTSCLHTFYIEEYQKDNQTWIKFKVHPRQHDNVTEKECHAQVIDRRTVRSSGGHESHRYVIKTTLQIGSLTYPIELTLNGRDKMRFRMLLGRSAMKGRLLVNPQASFITQTVEG